MKQTCGALVLVTRYYLARRAARESPNRMQVRSLQYFSIVGLPSKNKSISQFHSMWILKELPIASTMFSSRFLPLLFRVSEKEVLKTHEESQCICLVNLTFGKSSKHIHLMHPVFFPTKSPKRSHTLLGGYLRNQQTTSHDSIQKSREKKKTDDKQESWWNIIAQNHGNKSWNTKYNDTQILMLKNNLFNWVALIEMIVGTQSNAPRTLDDPNHPWPPWNLGCSIGIEVLDYK